MREEEFERVMHCMNGYWSKPEMDDDTHAGFLVAIRDLNIQPEDAFMVIQKLSIEPEHRNWRPRPGTVRAALLAASRRPTERRTKPCPKCDGTTWIQMNPSRGTVGPQNVVRCSHCAGLGVVAGDSLEEEEDYAANARKWVPILKEQLKNKGLRKMDGDRAIASWIEDVSDAYGLDNTA